MIEAHQSAKTLKNERYAFTGTIALGVGLILVLARAVETAQGIPGLPRSWYQNDWLWWLVGLASIGLGARLLAQSESQESTGGWKPSRPGQRFRELVLYTRDGCQLCDEAAELLHGYSRWLPAITTRNIETDPNLVQKFGTCIPVVALDGKIRFRGKVNQALLRRLIEGTPPVG
jgi:glutaredoxin-like protein DUF836